MARKRLPIIWLILACAAGLDARPAGAQVLLQRSRTDLPAVSRIFPAGIQRGQLAEIVVTGERLEGMTGILGPAGLRLVRVVSIDKKQARIELAAEADAAPGIFPLHFLCKAGLSNPKLLAIDAWPQSSEKEDNNTFAAATPISTSSAVNAVLGKTDVDCYRFEAKAGESLVFDVEARRLGAALAPTMTLLDASARELRRAAPASSGVSLETRLVHEFSADGAYVLRVHDRLYAGSDNSVYRLRIGRIPFAAAMYPLGGQRGAKTRVTLAGGSLAQPLAYDVDLTGDVLWQRKQLEIPCEPGALLSPALFAVGEYPEVLEQAPNETPEAAQPLAAPVTFNGRIETPGDCDWVRFHAKAGEKLTFRVFAQQLGSPLDSVLRIVDASGKELLAADDRPAAPREWPVVRPLTPRQQLDDPLAEFESPADGEYVVSIEDRYGHGGAAYAYRLELAPAQTDFDLVVQPGLPANPRDPKAVQQQSQVLQEFSGAATGALNLDRGGTASLLVRAFRNGYTGPIALKVEGLPAGVQAAPGTIPAGQNDTTLNLIADFEAPSTAAWLRVIGSGQIEPGAERPAAIRLERLAQQPVVWASLPASGVAEEQLPAIALGISQIGAELAVRGTLGAEVVAGGGVPLRVAIRRREGYAGEVSVELANLPTGLSGAPIKIAPDRNEAEVQLAASPALTPGQYQFLLEGSLAVAGKKEPIKASFPVAFEAYPPVSLELAAQQVEVPQGGSVKLELRLHRHGPALPIELTVLQLPRGLTAEKTAVPADAERFDLTLQAGDKAIASPIRRIVQIKAQTRLGDHVIELPTLRFALKVTRQP